MRKLLVLLMAAVVLVSLAVPATYFVLARDLPPLIGRDEVYRTMKVMVEGQRQQEFAGVDMRLVEPFTVLREGDISPALRNGALAAQGCPDYFAAPKESGTPWLLRVVGFGAGGDYGDPGPARCELELADRLAVALGLPDAPRRALASHELHTSLTKQELLDLELSVRYFAPGVLGVRSASKRLMGKEPRALNVAEAAELLLAELDYDEVWRCRNPMVLKLKRNNVVEQLAAFKLIGAAEAAKAKAQPLHCLSRPG